MPFTLSKTQFSASLQLVSIDLWGPSPHLSSKGYIYCISFIDHFSIFTWITLLEAKSHALQAFIIFKKQVELQIGVPLKMVQIDGE